MIVKIQTPQNNSTLTRYYEGAVIHYEPCENGVLLFMINDKSNKPVIQGLTVEPPYEIYFLEDGKTIDSLYSEEIGAIFNDVNKR